MKPTDTELGKFYNIGRHTIGKYRKNRFRTYNALVMYYNSINSKDKHEHDKQ